MLLKTMRLGRDLLEEKYSLPEYFKKVKVASLNQAGKKNQEVADEEAEIIGTGNGGMSGGKHFLGIWGTESRLSFPAPFFFGYTEWNVGSYFPKQRSNPCPMQWKHRVLATGPPGKSSSAFLD